MNEQKIYQRHQGWIFWLTGSWLIATFEHNYYTLSKYSLGKIWTIFGTDIPISDIATFLLVLALELTLFWSVSFVPFGKRNNIQVKVVYAALIISTFFSVILNVKYMIMASPTPGFMDITIGAVIGGLIPIFVVLFGYIEGHMVDAKIEKEETVIFERGNKKAAVDTENGGSGVTWEQIAQAKIDNPKLTRRQLAQTFDVPLSTIQNFFTEAEKRRKTNEV